MLTFVRYRHPLPTATRLPARPASNPCRRPGIARASSSPGTPQFRSSNKSWRPAEYTGHTADDRLPEAWRDLGMSAVNETASLEGHGGPWQHLLRERRSPTRLNPAGSGSSCWILRMQAPGRVRRPQGPTGRLRHLAPDRGCLHQWTLEDLPSASATIFFGGLGGPSLCRGSRTTATPPSFAVGGAICRMCTSGSSSRGNSFLTGRCSN